MWRVFFGPKFWAPPYFLVEPMRTSGVCDPLGAGPSTHAQALLSAIKSVFHLTLLPPFWVLHYVPKAELLRKVRDDPVSAQESRDQQWLLRCFQTYVGASLVDWLLSVPEIWPLSGEEGSGSLTSDILFLSFSFLLFLLAQKWFFLSNFCVLRIDSGLYPLLL